TARGLQVRGTQPSFGLGGGAWRTPTAAAPDPGAVSPRAGAGPEIRRKVGAHGSASNFKAYPWILTALRCAINGLLRPRLSLAGPQRPPGGTPQSGGAARARARRTMS